MAHPRHLTTTFRGGSYPEIDLVYQGVVGFRIAESE